MIVMKKTDLLSQYDIRDSRVRRKIAGAIVSLGQRHFSAEDVLKNLKRKKSEVSRASTFRALNLFSQKRFLETIDLGKGFKMYEVSGNHKHHDHLYCLRCSSIIEFGNDHIEELQAKVCRRRKFIPLSHTLRIVGLCQKCGKKG